MLTYKKGRLKRLIDHLPVAVFEYTFFPDGRRGFTFISPYCEELLGLKPEVIMGSDFSIHEFIHPEDWTSFDESIDQGRRNKRWTWQGRCKGKEDYIWIEAKSRSVKMKDGRTVYNGVFTDISERKKAEASFKKAETLFYQLFQNTPLAIVLLNEEGKVVQINKGFEELFNYNPEELKGMVLNQSIVPSELELEGNEINSLITENKVIRVDTIRQRKDGKRLSVIIYGVPVLLHDRKIGIFGMYVDITDRKKVEEELKVRNTELDNFVYKVSHDLRAPLSSVLGLAHLAGLPGNDDNLTDYIRLMAQKVEQLDHFISDVLSHSKNLKMDIKVEKVEFERILDQTFSDLNYLPGAGGIKREVRISGDEFYSDPWRIAEIFRNLVSNAIKYRRLDVPEALIKIDVKTNERESLVLFQDNGTGIEKARLGRIFEMFYRASNQSDGSGLGLYIVKNALDKLNGQIIVESEPNVGTTFKITIPNRRLTK